MSATLTSAHDITDAFNWKQTFSFRAFEALIGRSRYVCEADTKIKQK